MSGARYRIKCEATGMLVSLDMVMEDGTPSWTRLPHDGDAYPHDVAEGLGEWYEEETGNAYELEREPPFAECPYCGDQYPPEERHVCPKQNRKEAAHAAQTNG